MKILVASSGNHDESGGPVTAAASFPWPEGSEIHVLSVAEVIQPVAVSMERDSIDVVDVQVRTAAEAKAAASGAARHLQDRGFQSEGIAMEGNPETAIIEHARNWGADLIVVGSHDRSLLERLLMGNVSDRVVKHSPCSVLVVKPRVAA